MTVRMPYPGLRPFGQDEVDIFFGREEQTDELLRRLADARFLGIVGPSGCGKSSLVKAGLIAALETGFLASAGSRWSIALMRPGSHPLARLAVALRQESAFGAQGACSEEETAFLEATLSRGPLGLIEAFHETSLGRHDNLLVVVDQFEEIFRFGREQGLDQAAAFVALLVESAAHQEVPIYVVITMRSDFIGDCTMFPGLPETLNATQYLTPRLSREQRRDAIVGPARVFGGDVEPELVNRLLNDMGSDPDQLPVLQHVLMRMWARTERGSATCSGESTERGIQPAEAAMDEAPTRVLRMSDYEAVGGFKTALSKHADEAFFQLDDRQRHIAETLFRRLCERGTNKREVRRPTPLSEVADVARATPAEVIDVVNHFRDPEHGFLLPAPPESLHPNTVLDISHESLIRQWDHLNEWVEREAESAKTYRFLKDTASLWKAHRAALWGTPNLENALDWKERERPTPEWAERYGGDFKPAMEFLDTSEEERVARADREEAERTRELEQAKSLAEAEGQRATMQLKVNRLLRRITMALGLLVVVLLAGVIGHRYLYVWEHAAYYNTFSKVWGAPKGIGELTPEQVRSRSVSLKIVRKGRLGPVQYMESVNSRGELSPHHGIGTYLDLDSYESSPRGHCRWEFVYDARGDVTYELAYDKRGELVWGFVYSPPLEGDKHIRRAHYVGPDAYPRLATKSAATFVEIRYSPDGYEEFLYYKDRNGRPLPGPDQAYGQERAFDTRGLLVRMTSLGADNSPMSDTAGNASLALAYDDLGNQVEAVAHDVDGAATTLTDGWSKATYAYDGNGNLVEATYYDASGRPTLHKLGYHRETRRTDDRGNYVEQAFWGIDGDAAVLADGQHRVHYQFDERGNQTRATHFDSQGKLTPTRAGFAIWTAKYDEESHLVEEAYYVSEHKAALLADGYNRAVYEYDERGHREETSYFGVDGELVLHKSGYARKVEEFTGDNSTKVTYFDTVGQPATIVDGYSGSGRKYEDGKLTKLVYFDSKRKPVTSKSGFAGWSSEYDQFGNEVSYTLFDSEERPVNGLNGYAKVRSEYDSLGNEKRRAFFGPDGQPVVSSDGIAAWESEFDAVGNEVSRRYFGVDGKPTTHRQGYAGWSSRYDTHGNEIECIFHDVNDKLARVRVELPDGSFTKSYARRTHVYDALNNVVEKAYFGIYGEPTLTVDGYAHVRYHYDVRGNKSESAYFGTHGEPKVLKAGYHLIKRKHDDHGNPIEVEYFHSDGKPVHVTEGYVRLVSRYDRYDNLIEQAAYSVRGKRAVRSDLRFHKFVRKYDDFGRQLEEAYFGADDKPMFHRDGYKFKKSLYNSRGKEVETSYYSDIDQLTDHAGGYAQVRYKYDTRGRLLKTRYLDANDQPTSNTSGYATLIAAHDERGNITSVATFDARGFPVLRKHTLYWKLWREYSAQGNVIRVAYFGQDRRPAKIAEGYASIRAKYDAHGNLIERTFFGTDEKPVSCSDGYHREETVYNGLKQQVESAMFDADGALARSTRLKCARLTWKYDARGNQLEVATFDATGRLTASRHGYARMTYEFDEYGNKVAEAYFGDDGKPSPLDNTFVRATWKFDPKGNAVEEAYFGENGLPVLCLANYASMESCFNGRRQITERRYFGTSHEEPVHFLEQGQHITRYAYDGRGNKTEETYFGVNDEPTLGYCQEADWTLCARWTATYDAVGDLVESKCHIELPEKAR